MKYLWTTINVEDMDCSIEFYSDVVGLKVLNRFQAGPDIEIAFMGNGTDNETLVELLTDSGNGTVGFSEFISLGFAVDSVEEMLEFVGSKNIPIHSGPFETPSFKYFCIKDPDGLQVQFFQQK